MITYKELKETCLSFRRLSSNFLNSTENNASALIQRFKSYIDTTPFISELIQNTISGLEYDYHECFKKDVYGGWSVIQPPVDEACHVKAMYDYLSAIIDNNANVLGAAMSYCPTAKKFDDIIRQFLDEAFKPLIDFINDSFKKEMILLEEERTPAFTQNIGKVYGTVNQQASGTINSIAYVYPAQAEQILELIGKIMPCIDMISDVPDDALEDVKDDLNVCRRAS